MSIQQKYFVTSDIVGVLSTQGINLGPTRDLEYTYFQMPGINSPDEVLRIKSEGEHHILDLRKRDRDSGIWAKDETTISNPAAVVSITNRLGADVRVVLKKRFRSWKNDILALDLVSVNGLFTVLEAKFPPENREQASAFMRGLGFDPSLSDPRSSVEIYIEMTTGEKQ